MGWRDNLLYICIYLTLYAHIQGLQLDTTVLLPLPPLLISLHLCSVGAKNQTEKFYLPVFSVDQYIFSWLLHSFSCLLCKSHHWNRANHKCECLKYLKDDFCLISESFLEQTVLWAGLQGARWFSADLLWLAKIGDSLSPSFPSSSLAPVCGSKLSKSIQLRIIIQNNPHLEEESNPL